MELAQELKHFQIKVNGTLSIEKAFITGGGVSLKEIVPNQMASKFMDGLYFAERSWIFTATQVDST